MFFHVASVLVNIKFVQKYICPQCFTIPGKVYFEAGLWHSRYAIIVYYNPTSYSDNITFSVHGRKFCKAQPCYFVLNTAICFTMNSAISSSFIVINSSYGGANRFTNMCNESSSCMAVYFSTNVGLKCWST